MKFLSSVRSDVLATQKKHSATSPLKVLSAIGLCFFSAFSYSAPTILADQPVRSTTAVPANVMLLLSVEWPTGVVQAHNDISNGCTARDGNGDSVCYFSDRTYLGYFDPYKCYTYNTGQRYFEPSGFTAGTSAGLLEAGDHSCSGKWSGNFMNWATTQTSDVFRWALTGGDRHADTASLSVLEKARHDGQGGFTQFPLKRIGGAVSGPVTPVVPSTVTPFLDAQIFARVTGLNTVMWVGADRAQISQNHPINNNNPNNTLDVPPPGFTRDENGLCADYIGPATCTQLTTFSAGTRRLTIHTSASESGACPVSPSVSCTTVLAPTPFVPAIIGVTASPGTKTIPTLENGLCGAIPGCTQNSVFTREYEFTETGRCDAFTGAISCTQTVVGVIRINYTESIGNCTGFPSGGATCTVLSASSRRITNASFSGTATNGAGCASTGPTLAMSPPLTGSRVLVAGTCSVTTSPTRRVRIGEAGSCSPNPVPGAGRTFVSGSCTNPTVDRRTVPITTSGQCPTSPVIVGCVNTTAPVAAVTAVAAIPAFAGTRTVVRETIQDVAGVCPGVAVAGTVNCLALTPAVPTTTRRVADTTTTVSAYYVRVKVCDTSFPESASTCTIYGSSNKPTGIMQENALKMRFGAIGYLRDNSATRDGGVLRSKMKDVGPMKAKPGEAPVTNTRAEWNAADGTYILNSDSADATATGFGVAQSGVISYLNKFGRQSGYKGFDPVSELYAEALKYFKNKGATPEYSAGANAGMADGSPIITTWDDPIQFACQKNFIIGIADANTHKDKNLNGNTDRTQEPAATPASIDTDYNVVTLTDAVGNAEVPVMANLGAKRHCCDGGEYIAGLAYYAHTQDLRADFDNLNGPQTIGTYFVDVREAGSAGTTGDPRNQLWLAAKYGGFEDSNKDGLFQPAEKWANVAAGAVQGYPVPKNYFAANQPDKLANGLRDAFRDINSLNGAGAGAGLATTNVSETNADDGLYQVKFDTSGWTGSVKGFDITAVDDVTGTISISANWDAGTLLDTRATVAGWHNSRIVATINGSGAGAVGKPFRLNDLTTNQKTALTPVVADQQEVVDYLRGDTSKYEQTLAGVNIPGGKYRTRKSILGDIVDAEALYVGAPNADYADDLNAGYSAFKTAKAGRKPMVYVGANDGMMHAFDAKVSSTNATRGAEVFAFVPNAVYAGPTGTPSVNGITILKDTNYAHKYFVNATGNSRDIDFNKTSVTNTATPDWRTIYVSGLGKGGRSYFAIDVTDPGLFTSEANVAAKVMWEFTDADMGFSYGLPIIVKTRKWGWVVVLASGYNNLDGIAANKGRGFIFILDAKTGLLLQKVGTPAGTATNPSGLAHLSGYTPSFAGYLTDEVYGGDLLGNVWRFDFTSATADVPTPTTAFAIVKDDNDVVQPITTRPFIEYSADDLKRYVFVGTGKLLDTADTISPQAQHFYAIRDGLREKRYEATDTATGIALPSGVSFPIGKADLAVLSSTVTGLSAAQIIAKPMGWRYELKGTVTKVEGTVTKIARERVNLQYSAGNNIISWTGNLPDISVCNPNGVSYLYATTYGTGKSRFRTVSAGGVITLNENVSSSAVVKSQLVNRNGTTRVLITDQQGTPSLSGGALNTIGLPRQLNWREVIQ